MAERSVHEAAVEATAGALCSARPDHMPPWPGVVPCFQCTLIARRVIAALVASAEVRKGLVRAVLASTDAWFLGADDPRNDTGSNGFRPWPLVDEVRAALAGTENDNERSST